jgi:hypothetical protein
MLTIPPVVQTEASKLKALLTSRRFWALIIALVTMAAGLATHNIGAAQAITDAAGALAAYMLAVGVGG